MEATLKISVIVPVYNTEKYLKRCVDSILSQTYTNLEVILVDDGSTDESGKICDEYSENDPRVKVIHKENGGQGTARNMALDVMEGDFVAFVDSDDTILPTMYECLHNNLVKYGADISCCSNSDVEYPTGKVTEIENPEMMAHYFDGYNGLNQSPCNKLYKKELFDGVRFMPLRAYEDSATLFKPLFKAKKAVFQDTVLYFYNKRENSTMTQPFSAVKYQSIIANFEVYEFYKKNVAKYTKLAAERVAGSIQFCVGETLVRNLKNELAEQYNFAVKTLKAIPSKHLNRKQKITRFLIVHLPCIYKKLYERKTR